MFSKQVAYAIRCLVYLSQQKEPVLIRDIAEATKMPGPYLAKIINILTRKGILHSQRGIGGGISLLENPESISICDVCIMFDDPLLDSDCVFGLPDCSAENACALHGFWSKQKENIINFLRINTISTLAKTDRSAKKQLNKELKRDSAKS